MRRPKLSPSRILWALLVLFGGAAVKWLFGRDDERQGRARGPGPGQADALLRVGARSRSRPRGGAPTAQAGQVLGPEAPLPPLHLRGGADAARRRRHLRARSPRRPPTPANTYSSKADWKAPTVDRSVIQPNGGNNASAGFVKQGQSYFVYANVTDTGNPASGISSVTANVCNVTSASCSAVAMTAGSYTVNSITYNYRSARADRRCRPLGGLEELLDHRHRRRHQLRQHQLQRHRRQHRPDRDAPDRLRRQRLHDDRLRRRRQHLLRLRAGDRCGQRRQHGQRRPAAPATRSRPAATTVAMTSSGGPWTIGGQLLQLPLRPADRRRRPRRRGHASPGT